MVQLGYALSSEEHSPADLVRHARRAEEVGFTFALISDHFHPWISRQGHSPFVWSILGAIAQATERLSIGTGVTCPTVRIHPAIIAQAAATTAALMPGRFFLGLGTGENLNEHITGARWPEYEVRADMFDEAVNVIRLLWQGGNQSFHGKYYTVENAQLFTLPDQPPAIMIAGAGKTSATMAGRLGNGLISTSPEKEVVQAFEQQGRPKRPKYGQVTVCWAKTEAEARQTAYKIWPNAAITGELSQELPTPKHFEQAAKMIKEEDVAQTVICGNDSQQHLQAIQQYLDAGFDHVYVHQIGPDQEGFFQFYRQHILPRFQ